mmetsp:Transcript_35478/g.80072  ORF Transcript_35478/g.80072 Transcript_35478/m.80072 type:complete len:235 (+) Transcript_35478:162-866(+)
MRWSWVGSFSPATAPKRKARACDLACPGCGALRCRWWWWWWWWWSFLGVATSPSIVLSPSLKSPASRPPKANFSRFFDTAPAATARAAGLRLKLVAIRVPFLVRLDHRTSPYGTGAWLPSNARPVLLVSSPGHSPGEAQPDLRLSAFPTPAEAPQAPPSRASSCGLPAAGPATAKTGPLASRTAGLRSSASETEEGVREAVREAAWSEEAVREAVAEGRGDRIEAVREGSGLRR